MSVDQIIKEATSTMEKALEALKREMTRLRTGRASLAMLDDVRVEYYGQLLPINQVATMNIPEPRLITIAPWESNIIPQIEKAIQKSGLGLSAVNDGKIVRIPIPALTEERRKELVKVLKTHAEETRIAIRQSRRVANEAVKALEKASSITEDESKKQTAAIQKLTDTYVAKVDDLAAQKEQEILKV